MTPKEKCDSLFSYFYMELVLEEILITELSKRFARKVVEEKIQAIIECELNTGEVFINDIAFLHDVLSEIEKI